jgi:small subunit ribosomal protein S3
MVAEQIERRVAYRRAMKQAIFRSIQAGAKGVKISCGGRLGGADIARRQTMHEGRVPLQTLRADIGYGLAEAQTALSKIGIKVWIYKGEILPESKEAEVEEAPVEMMAIDEGTELTPPVEAEEAAFGPASAGSEGETTSELSPADAEEPEEKPEEKDATA